jgi:ribokinase
VSKEPIMQVLTVGGAMIDTIAIIENSAIERMSLLNAGASFLLLEEGRKTEALEVSTHCGGGAINAAVAFARLGLQTATLIKLGRDRRAEQILARLAEDGIACDWVVQDGSAPTGSSVHVSSHDRNAAVFTFRGANTLLSPGDLADTAFATGLVYVANLSNEAARCFPVIIEKAKAASAMVAANPGIRQLQERGEEFKATLPFIDILSLNRREADEVLALLASDETEREDADALSFPDGVDPPPIAGRGLKFESRRAGVRSFFHALLRRGVGCVVLTDGRDGAFAATGSELLYCPAHEAPVAGTAGAGDAFAATFSAYVARGNGPRAALRAATVNAASVLGFVDTQTGLLNQRALDLELNGNKAIPNVIAWGL